MRDLPVNYKHGVGSTSVCTNGPFLCAHFGRGVHNTHILLRARE